MSTSHLYICASDYTEFVCTVASEHCFPVQRSRSSFGLQRRKPRVVGWVFGWQSYRMQEALLHKYLLFPAALVFLSVGIRGVVQMYRGTALAITRVVMPITFIGLWRSAMTLVFLSCVRDKRMLHQIYVRFLFFENLSRQRLNFHGFVLVVNICFEFVCPLHFYI